MYNTHKSNSKQPVTLKVELAPYPDGMVPQPDETKAPLIIQTDDDKHPLKNADEKFKRFSPYKIGTYTAQHDHWSKYHKKYLHKKGDKLPAFGKNWVFEDYFQESIFKDVESRADFYRHNALPFEKPLATHDTTPYTKGKDFFAIQYRVCRIGYRGDQRNIFQVAETGGFYPKRVAPPFANIDYDEQGSIKNQVLNLTSNTQYQKGVVVSVSRSSNVSKNNFGSQANDGYQYLYAVRVEGGICLHLAKVYEEASGFTKENEIASFGIAFEDIVAFSRWKTGENKNREVYFSEYWLQSMKDQELRGTFSFLCGNLPHPNVGKNPQNLAKAAHYIPIADSADERDALIAENMAKRLQGKENVNALDGSFQGSKPVDAEEVPKDQEELVQKPSLFKKITGSVGLFKKAKEAPKPLEKKVLIYKAPSGELAIKFNTKEAFQSFMGSVIHVKMPKNYVNPASPQFKNNPKGYIPNHYEEEENTMFFPSYTAGNGEFAINVVSSQLQGNLVKNIFGGTHKKSASTATNSSDIKDLFCTHDTKGQESAIYFNQNHPVFSENASIEIAFDDDDEALTDSAVILKGNPSSPAMNKLG